MPHREELISQLHGRCDDSSTQAQALTCTNVTDWLLSPERKFVSLPVRRKNKLIYFSFIIFKSFCCFCSISFLMYIHFNNFHILASSTRFSQFEHSIFLLQLRKPFVKRACTYRSFCYSMYRVTWIVLNQRFPLVIIDVC